MAAVLPNFFLEHCRMEIKLSKSKFGKSSTTSRLVSLRPNHKNPWTYTDGIETMTRNVASQECEWQIVSLQINPERSYKNTVLRSKTKMYSAAD